MKVILLADVAKVGRKYTVQEVSPGYGTNYLIPQGLARVASVEAMGALEDEMKKAEVAAAKEAEALSALFEKLDGETVEVSHKANEQGGLFSAVTSDEVAKAISEMAGETIEAAHVIVPEVKELGSYTVVLQSADANAKVTLKVSKEAE